MWGTLLDFVGLHDVREAPPTLSDASLSSKHLPVGFERDDTAIRLVLVVGDLLSATSFARTRCGASSADSPSCFVVVEFFSGILGDSVGPIPSFCDFLAVRPQFEGDQLAKAGFVGDNFADKGSAAGVLAGDVLVTLESAIPDDIETPSDAFEDSKFNLDFARAAFAFSSVSLALDSLSFTTVGDVAGVERGTLPILVVDGVLVLEFTPETLLFGGVLIDSNASLTRPRFFDSNSRFFSLSLARTGLSTAFVTARGSEGVWGDDDGIEEVTGDGSFDFKSPANETGIVQSSLESSAVSGKSDTFRPHFSINASYLNVAISESK